MESIQQKQLYLREKIIDAGHDAEEFVQYCTNQHELVDLEDWPLQKLKTVVDLYAKIKNNSLQNSKNHKKDPEQDWGNFQSGVNSKNQTLVEKNTQIKDNFNQNNNTFNSTTTNGQIYSNTTKTGQLVFSQADWDIFMGSGNGNTQATVLPQIKIQQAFQEPFGKKAGVNPSLDIKNQKKSPVNNKSKSEQINWTALNLNMQIKIEDKKQQKFKPVQTQIKPQIEGKDNPLSPPSQQIKKNNDVSQKSPINLINIKLVTAKAKALPKLPQINDIHITKTEQISRNFLQSDYTQYFIQFTPGSHLIQRKFTDLRKLRAILQKMYPHFRLPYLQPQGWINSSQGKDSQTLAKYKWMVIDFIKYIIIRNQELKNCQIVRKFCGYSTNPKNLKQTQLLSRQQLKKMLQGYQSLARPKYIGQLCLNQNSFMIPPIKNGQRLIQNTNGLLIQVDNQYQKLRKQFQNLFYNYQLISKSFVQITSTFQNLQNLIKKYNYDNNESKQLRVYDGLRQMTNKMQNTINQQYIVFKSRLRNVFRFEKDNMNTLKELIQNKNKIHYEYARQGYPFLSSTSKINGGQLQVDSNISIDEPCRNNKNTLCIQQIFWAHSTKQEIRSYWEQLRKKINQQLTLIAYDQLDNQNDNLNFWNSVIKKCVV